MGRGFRGEKVYQWCFYTYYVLSWTPIDSADLYRMLIILGSRHQSREIEITNPGNSYHTAS